MAVIDEGSDIHTSEVHEQLYLGKGNICLKDPEWNLNHVQKLTVDGRGLLRSIDLEVVLRENLEMDLVHMKFMVLPSYVLNIPLFDESLRGNHRRRIVVVEHHWLLARAYLGDEEFSRCNTRVG